MATKNAPKFVFEAVQAQQSTEVEVNGIAVEGSVVVDDDGNLWIKVGNLSNDGTAQKPWTNKAGKTVKQSLLAVFNLGSFKVNGKVFGLWKDFHSQKISLVRED
jgi:beta-xylosidase